MDREAGADWARGTPTPGALAHGDGRPNDPGVLAGAGASLSRRTVRSRGRHLPNTGRTTGTGCSVLSCVAFARTVCLPRGHLRACHGGGKSGVFSRRRTEAPAVAGTWTWSWRVWPCDGSLRGGRSWCRFLRDVPSALRRVTMAFAVTEGAPSSLDRTRPSGCSGCSGGLVGAVLAATVGTRSRRLHATPPRSAFQELSPGAWGFGPSAAPSAKVGAQRREAPRSTQSFALCSWAATCCPLANRRLPIDPRAGGTRVSAHGTADVRSSSRRRPPASWAQVRTARRVGGDLGVRLGSGRDL